MEQWCPVSNVWVLTQQNTTPRGCISKIAWLTGGDQNKELCLRAWCCYAGIGAGWAFWGEIRRSESLLLVLATVRPPCGERGLGVRANDTGQTGIVLYEHRAAGGRWNILLYTLATVWLYISNELSFSVLQWRWFKPLLATCVWLVLCCHMDSVAWLTSIPIIATNNISSDIDGSHNDTNCALSWSFCEQRSPSLH